MSCVMCLRPSFECVVPPSLVFVNIGDAVDNDGSEEAIGGETKSKSPFFISFSDDPLSNFRITFFF